MDHSRVNMQCVWERCMRMIVWCLIKNVTPKKDVTNLRDEEGAGPQDEPRGDTQEMVDEDGLRFRNSSANTSEPKKEDLRDQGGGPAAGERPESGGQTHKSGGPRRPHLAILGLWGLAIGGCQGFLLFVWPKEISDPSLMYGILDNWIFCLLAFWAGVLSCRGGWLESRGGRSGGGPSSAALAEQPSQERSSLLPREDQDAVPTLMEGADQNNGGISCREFGVSLALSTLMGLSLFVLNAVEWKNDGPRSLGNMPPESATSVGLEDALAIANRKHPVPLGFGLGLFGVSTFVVFLYSFKRWGNRGGSSYSKFVWDAAYAVFIIHDIVIALLFWGWAAIVDKQTTQQGFVWLPTSRVGATKTGDGWLWGGFFFVFLSATVSSWILGWLLKQAPGLRDIL